MWIIPVSIAVIFLVIFFMPKNITWREIYLTWGIVGFLSWTADIVSPSVIDLYNIGPTKDEP
jgi:hypothetical protein